MVMSEGNEVWGGGGRGEGRGAGRGTGDASTGVRSGLGVVAAGLGVAIVPEQLKRLEHEGVVFRPLDPIIMTEGCVAWRNESPSSALQAYIRIVEQSGTSIR